MTHIWTRDATGSWVSRRLALPAYSIVFAPDGAFLKERTKGSEGWPALLSSTTATEQEDWALVGPPACNAKVNGFRVHLGIRVLLDRDVIEGPGGGLICFSTERLAEVVPLPALEDAVMCPRCKMQIDTEDSAVKCPQCGTWHHQSEDRLPCWTYAEHCSLCDQTSDSDGEYRWTPEVL